MEVEPYVAGGLGRAEGNRDEPVESLVDEKVDPRVGIGPGVTADLSAPSDGHFDLAAQHDLDAFGGCGEHAERRTRGHALTEEGVELVDEDRARLVDARAAQRATGRQELVDRCTAAAGQREQRHLAEARHQPFAGHHCELEIVEANGGGGHDDAQAASNSDRRPRRQCFRSQGTFDRIIRNAIRDDARFCWRERSAEASGSDDHMPQRLGLTDVRNDAEQRLARQQSVKRRAE